MYDDSRVCHGGRCSCHVHQSDAGSAGGDHVAGGASDLSPWIKARTTEQQQANLSALASTLVFAAEQLYGANRGQEKLAYVTSILREHGYDVDSQEVLATVEAAVNQMVPYQELHAVEAENTQQNSAN